MRRFHVPGGRRLCAALLLGLGVAFGARADVIHLHTGGIIRGDIVKETEDEVHVKTLGGAVTTVFRADIERIERNKTPKDVLEDKVKALAKGDAQGRYELGLWAKKARLDAEARALFEEAIALEPNHQGARGELGYTLRQGQWVTLADAQRIDKERGDSQVEDLDGAEDEKALEAALKARNVAPSLQAGLKGIRKGLLHRDPAERAKALGLLDGLAALRLADLAREAAAKGTAAPVAATIDDEVKAASIAMLEDMAAKLRKGALKSRARELQALVPLDKLDKRELEARQKLLDRWVKAKDEAIEVIFDLKIYPDENHGAVGQPIVDEKVKGKDGKEGVVQHYARYEPVLLADLHGLLNDKRLPDRLAAWETAKACLEVVERALAARGGQPSTEPAPGPSDQQLLLIIYRAGRVREAYGLKDRLKDKLTPWEVRLYERLRDVRVYEYNESVLASRTSPDQGQLPTGPEHDQVRITNDYRVQMGRPAIEIHPCLVESARGHSNEMTRLGYFEHDSPVPENRTPSMRAAKAGYPGGAAENISLGSVAPKATHEAWYNSSGHHRNILDAGHRAMGSGQDAQHWTQNFGSQGQLDR
jgi:hypothetical protein